MNWKIALFVGLVVLASGCTSSQDANTNDQPDTTADPGVADENEDSTDSDSDTDTTSDSSDTSSDSGVNDNNIIYLTSSGFQPQSLTVELGEEVTWINNASQDMWVASNEHPWHTNYAGDNIRDHCNDGQPTNDNKFDQCSVGDRYSFTFEKTGEWGFHNHENSAQTGTITVQ